MLLVGQKELPTNEAPNLYLKLMENYRYKVLNGLGRDLLEQHF